MEKEGDKSDSKSQGGRNSGHDSSSSFEAIVQNMAIAHEMAIDADFRLNEVPSDSWVNTALLLWFYDLWHM